MNAIAPAIKRNNMQAVFFPFRLLYFIYVAIVFIVLMLLVLPVLLVAVPMGAIRGGNLLFHACKIWSDVWMALCGIYSPRIYAWKGPIPEKCIYVANHISYLDIPMIFKCVRKPIRILGKAEMAAVPVFGLIYKMAVVMVDRRSPEKRAASIRRLRAVLRSGISIFLFPEGTFNETGAPLKEFFDGAFRLAIEMQVPVQPVLFPDTLERMHYKSLLELNPGKCRSVYLEPVPTEGLTMKDLPTLKAEVHRRMEAGLLACR